MTRSHKMNIGLVGWGCTTGNGGMNSDIASLSSFVTHWLIPNHPKMLNHRPYLDRAILGGTHVIETSLKDNFHVADDFLNQVDALLYIEHPCYKDKYNIVLEAKKKGKIVIGIPMWEWWPERKDWVLQTDILVAVTQFTYDYLNSLSNVLFAHGWQHAWRNKVIYNKWGVNLDCFKFEQRQMAKRFVFINGNGGYRLRKASDIVAKAFAKPGAPPLLVYTQQKEQIAQFTSSNIEIVHRNFPEREDVYSEGDVFLFPSYWEGLCHGVYEAQAVGGIVITSSQPPMSECGSPYLVSLERYDQEDLSGKKILKAVPSVDDLYRICSILNLQDISETSLSSRQHIESSFNLRLNLVEIYKKIINIF